MAEQVKFTTRELVDRFFPVYFYRKHLDLASRDILGLDLAPHHSLIMRDWGREKSTNHLFSSRGGGKTILSAIYYLLEAILWPKLKSIASAGTGFRGSKMVLLEIERICMCALSGQRKVQYALASLRDPRKIINRDPALWSINFKNGSSISAIPLGVTSGGDVIRGLRCSKLLMDESFLIPRKVYQSVLEPFQNVMYEPEKPPEEQVVKNASHAVSTNDYTHRDFYKQYLHYMAILEGDKEVDPDGLTKEDISCFEFNIEDYGYMYNGKRVSTWGLDYERVMKQRHGPTVDLPRWEAENLNKPINLQGSYFSFHAIDMGMNINLGKKTECFPRVLDRCSAPCILGMDSAPSGSNTAFVVLKAGAYNYKDRNIEECKYANNGQACALFGTGRGCSYKNYAAVIYAFEANKMDIRDKVKLLYQIIERYNIISIALDKRGGGFEISNLLFDQNYLDHLFDDDDENKVPTMKIYDPDQIQGIQDGAPILKLLATTQPMNSEFAGYMKGLITSQSLLFPKPIVRRAENLRIMESAGHCETLVNQVVRIKAIPAGVGIKFIIESTDPNTGRTVSAKKDLFSALLYAVGRMKQLIEEEMARYQPEKEELVLPISFNF